MRAFSLPFAVRAAARLSGLVVLCAVLVAASARPAEAQESIRVVPLARDGSVLVSFSLADGFTDDVRAAIASGLRTSITYTVELRLEVPFWVDRTIAEAVVSSSVQYDNLTRRASVTRSVDGRTEESRVLEDEAGIRNWLTSLQRIPLFNTARLEPNREYYIRVSARTQPRNGSLPWSTAVSGFAKFTFLP
jgi:hypothetical protein